MRGPAATFTSSEKEADFLDLYHPPGSWHDWLWGVLARTAVNACLTRDDGVTRSAALWAWIGGQAGLRPGFLNPLWGQPDPALTARLASLCHRR